MLLVAITVLIAATAATSKTLSFVPAVLLLQCSVSESI